MKAYVEASPLVVPMDEHYYGWQVVGEFTFAWLDYLPYLM